jgi:mRNA interferase MazF
MKRGDVVTVAIGGDYGKPRPAVIVQTDALPESHASTIICQMTSVIEASRHLRVLVEPSAANGLRIRSQVMADKPIAIHRKRVGRTIGRLTDQEMAQLDVALAFAMGLTD